MRSLVYYVATSVDGFIADVDGGFDAFAMQGPHLDAIVAELPETLPVMAREAMGLSGVGRFDTVLEGRATHQIGLDAGIPDAYPHLRHVVFSRSLPDVAPAIELVRTDPVARIRELKAEDGRDIWLCGGGKLAATLLPEIDELVLKISPVLLGDGIPLVAGGATRPMTATGTRTFDNGVVWQTYKLD
ncbi:dihydrofolate reductase family protein [Aeromicrobium sp. CF4.19]|uniref:dihydrofolate reductase family protein n=1 Tax=Aeromicrobium sp. CF4.19 TaxID=3373082 RepID=UPI003EE62047